MQSEVTYISKEVRLQIDNDHAHNTADVARRYGGFNFKIKRNSIVGDCPQCQAKEGLTITESGAKAGVFKCFHCDLGGKGGAAYLQIMRGLNWKDAYIWLANEYNVDLGEAPATVAELSAKHESSKVSFRDLQLKHSGIPNDAQVCPVRAARDKVIEMNRYSPGTMNERGEYKPAGDDLVLHYVDLECNILHFTPKKGKPQPLIRVRYKHPDLHLDKDGKPVKYRSPYDSGSHLWLPQFIIKQYQASHVVKTLYVVEGEKKADKMCLHGLPAVGIMGIHNLAYNQMPRVFEQIIDRCKVEQVVFVLDSDWQDISASPGKAVDNRPRTFLRAVQKFREYFYGFRNSGHDLRIFMLAGKSAQYKGMDDLLSHLESENKEVLRQPGALAADVEAAIADGTGKGEFVQAFNIHPLRISDHVLSEKWYLDDQVKFFEAHKEALRELGEFKFKTLTYYYDQENDTIEQAQQILPAEKFWDIEEFVRAGRLVKEIKFNYDRIRLFLFNRGIGLYEYDPGMYRNVRRQGHIVHDVTHQFIQRYVVEYAETLKPPERDDVVQMLLRGNTQFLGPNNLTYMKTHNPEWVTQKPDEQIMVFRNCFWRITPTLIEQRPLNELPGCVWNNQVIPFDANYLGSPLVNIAKTEAGWQIKEKPESKKEACDGADNCELYEFLKLTSMFAWQKLYELRRDQDGTMRYFPRDEETREKFTAEEMKVWKMHIATKLIGLGYKMRSHRDKANMRVIVCMDGLESAVGKSQGGSGKSIYSMATEHAQSIFVVDGKTVDLKNDKFMYHGVDERTREIVFDDVRVNFDFESLFGQITRGIRVKPFQGAPIEIPAPVITINTNHTLNGEGNSFRRRQFFLGFSNFFNEHRTPVHHFGHELFTDWDSRQWNLYYNLMATATQAYMQHSDLARYGVESDDIERRKLRQQIGEDFLDFADLYYTPGYMLNRVVDKQRVLEDYFTQYPAARKFMDAKRIKAKCELFAKYAGLQYNPGAGPDGRIKSTGTEFIIVADDNFNLSNAQDKVYASTSVAKY